VGAGHAGSIAGTLLLLVISVALAVTAQLLLKSGMNIVGRIGSGDLTAPGAVVSRVVDQPRVWGGLVLYGISAMFWLVVLSRIPLSVAYPFVGMSYVVVVASARFALNEQVPLLRWLGVIVVAIGIVMVGLSFKRLTG
jgi:multidrug transporter EmrE-like cation transporter